MLTLMMAKKSILLCLILPLAFSCSEKNLQPRIAKETPFEPPKITVIANLPDNSKPVKIPLKKPATKIKAGTPKTHLFLDSSAHRILSPEEQTHGFFTNYTVEDGLALDAIWNSATDKDGNLWFGTDGGGVSRFDGHSFTNYTMKHGLLSDVVHTITQNRNGDIWFGTPSGASRFDGRGFTNYTTEDGLANNFVVSIYEDKFGRLWFATLGGGLSRYDGEKFVNLTTADGLPDNKVSAIAEDKSGNLWIGTTNGISLFDGKIFKNYTPPQLRNNFILTIVEDNQGNIWVGTVNGLFRYSIKEFDSDPGTAIFPTKNIRWMTKDRAGNLWICIKGDGVMRYDGRTFTRFTTTNGLSTNNVESVIEDKTGNIWVGTYGGGIIRYGGKSVMYYSPEHGLGDISISGIIEDKAGDIWFGKGGGGGGVVRYDGKSFSTYTTSQGLAHNGAWPRTKDKKENVWIATAGGANCFDGKSFTNYTQADGLCSNNISCIAETSDGKIWFGSPNQGATCYDGNSFINYSAVHGLPGNDIWCMTADTDSGLWISTRRGLARFNGSSFINYTTANGLPNNPIYCSAVDMSGNLWLGTMGGGVSRFDGKSFMNFTVEQGLPDNSVWAIAIDSAGKIIFGNTSGLAVLVQFNRDPPAEKESLSRPAQNDLKNNDLENYKPQFEIYNLSTGYPIRDPIAQTMIEDSKGILWMGTGAIESGLLRFDYSSVHKNKEPTIPVLHNVKINNETVCWNNLLPQSFRNDSSKGGPSPQITEEATTLGFILTEEARDSMRSKFKGIKFDSIRRFYPIPENLVLPYRHSNISFDFGSVELNRPSLVRYQYILEGYQKEWSPVENTTSAIFGNLPEGTYVFKLRTQGPFGIWSDPIEYTFKVLPPWHRTWWAYTLYILIFSTAVWGFVKWRVYAVEKENKALEEKVITRTKELEQSLEERYRLSKTIESQQALLNERLRISRELHDDIGSTLGSISIYSDVAKKRTEKNETASEVLSKIGIASREIIDKMSDIVWSLSPDNDNFEQLQNRMMAFAAMILTPRNILYDFNAEEELKNVRLTSEHRKNIFLIFKEALYNTVKYAECNKVFITLALQKNDLIMIIQDDGKGFDASRATVKEVNPVGEYVGGNGIKNMHARADDMKARLCINSKKDEGTTVQLIVSL
jgi:ligand-binding sensor domain-containing protein/signal transduction histidine kinase